MARNVTPRYIDNYLRRQGSPLAGQGQAFVTAGQKYDLDPLLLVAISGAESSFGKQAKPGTYNPFGWGPHKPLGSWEQGIDTVAGGLRRGYFDQGRDTVAEIGAKWAPIGAGNDPTGLNNNWTQNVSRIYGQLGGQQPAAQTGSVGVAAAGPGLPPQPRGSLAHLNSFLASVGDDPIDIPARRRTETPVAQLRTPEGSPDIPVVKTFRGRASKNMSAIVELAEHYLGTPYSWGGGGPGGPSKGIGRGANTVGFDCSGFLEFLWSKSGVAIGGTTYEQIKRGVEVPRGKLRPGDAVFFGSASDPHHVGMFIGNGQFIESPHTGAVVRISKLAGRKDYLTARRYA